MMSLFFKQNKKIQSQTPKRSAPLQAHNQVKKKKGALSWASFQLEASLSVEAALSLSLFLFFCFCLMMPMRMMDRQRQIQAVLESVGEEMSQYAYVEYCFRSMENGMEIHIGRASQGDQAGEEEGSYGAREGIAILAASYASSRVMGQINREWVEDVSFEGTDIGKDQMVRIVMEYRMRLPFSVLGLNSIPVRQICSRRMWNGAEGGRLKGQEDGQGDREEIVFIGKNPTRYHRLRTCHYLYNDLKAVPISQIDELRNDAGRKYSACKICGEGGHTGETVYVMPYSSSYHRLPECRSIIAYVRSVSLSEVEYLGECSYCGDNKTRRQCTWE